MKSVPSSLALGAVVVCALIWGTTWYAITLQLGAVDPIASIIYRFGLAALVLLGFCHLSGRSLKLTPAQHLAAAGQGLFTFAIDYAFVYWAEERIASAVVAVVFAGLAFLNLALFRLILRQKAARLAWLGAFLGLLGVVAMFGAELMRAEMEARALVGLGLALLAVLAAGIGNLFAWRGQQAGGGVLSMTGWAMAYGVGFLFIYALIARTPFGFETSWTYVLSLLHLSVLGSVVAFGLYFWLARARGYAMASYISALTPPLAMGISVVFEGARFGLLAFLGLGLVLAGQALLLRAPKTA